MNARHLDGDEPPEPTFIIRGGHWEPSTPAPPDPGVPQGTGWRRAAPPDPRYPIEHRPPRHPAVTGLWVGIGAAAGLALAATTGLAILTWLGVW